MKRADFGPDSEYDSSEFGPRIPERVILAGVRTSHTPSGRMQSTLVTTGDQTVPTIANRSESPKPPMPKLRDNVAGDGPPDVEDGPAPGGRSNLDNGYAPGRRTVRRDE